MSPSGSGHRWPFSMSNWGSLREPPGLGAQGWCSRSFPGGGGEGSSQHRADAALGTGWAPQSDRRDRPRLPAPQLSPVTLKKPLHLLDSEYSKGPMVSPPTWCSEDQRTHRHGAPKERQSRQPLP